MTDTFEPTHYLRFEGVNLGSFVFDTRDLSTTRGSSLLLLHAVQEIEPQLQDVRAQAISQGASIGLWAVATNQPEALAQRIRDHLRNHPKYQYGTFVVDMLPKADFSEDMESLIAANRWRQMQAASLSVPSESTAPIMGKSTCGLDGLREANPQRRIREVHLSEATWQRRQYGLKGKQEFYKGLTGLTDLDKYDFASEFKDIAKGVEQLDGKIAVFYADGNKFGGIPAKLCPTQRLLQKWDHYIRQERQRFLADFIQDEVLACPRDWIANGKIIRFETLLWGGDEVMFIMPAALGWRFACFFFKHFEAMNLRDANSLGCSALTPGDPTFPDHPLTHTASLVFCHHHAPIHRLKHLAKEQMAEFAKDVTGPKGESLGRNRNQLVCIALESFDNLGSGYESALKKRYNKVITAEQTILFGEACTPLHERLLGLAETIERLKAPDSEFARSQLRSLVVQMIQEDLKLADLGRTLKTFFFNAIEQDKAALVQLLSLFPAQETAWIQLEELWDYALP